MFLAQGVKVKLPFRISWEKYGNFADRLILFTQMFRRFDFRETPI